MKTRCIHTGRARPFLSFSLFHALLLFLRLLTLYFSLFRHPSPSFRSSKAGYARRFTPLPPTALPSQLSFPTVFLPLSCPKRLNLSSPRPTSSFSSATLPSLPLLFFYQPGRTRIHILQAFMMAAAHLYELACRATSSLPQAGSPLSSRSNTGSVQLTLHCLPLCGYNPMLFR